MDKYKLVPVEPTEEMIKAVDWPFGLILPLIHIYRAMIAAAPSYDADVDCPACEGFPVPQNNPCFVCGREREAVAIQRRESDE